MSDTGMDTRRAKDRGKGRSVEPQSSRPVDLEAGQSSAALGPTAEADRIGTVSDVLAALEAAKPKFEVFRCRNGFPAGTIHWGGGRDPRVFLDHAKSAGIRTIYLMEVFSGVGPWGFQETQNRVEPIEVQIAFFRDGFFHTFQSADTRRLTAWIALSGALSGTSDPVERYLDTLSESLEVPSPASDRELRSGFLRHLSKDMPGLVPPGDPGPPFLLAPAALKGPSQVLEDQFNLAVGRLRRNLSARERDSASELAPEVAAWAGERGISLTGLTQVRVGQFLAEREIRGLSRTGIADLTSHAIAEVKRLRRTETPGGPRRESIRGPRRPISSFPEGGE